MILGEAGARLWLLARLSPGPAAEDLARAQAAASVFKPWDRYDPDLGWSLIPSAAGPGITVNAQGFRARRVIEIPKPSDLRRVVILGDSFTFGLEVSDGEEFPARLDRLLAPQGESVNLGVEGYGIDQMLLRFERDGLPLNPDVAVMAVILDDFGRADHAVAVTGHAKPRFLSTPGGLTLSNVPVPEKGGARPAAGVRGFFAMDWALPTLARRALVAENPDQAGEFSPLQRAILRRFRDRALGAGSRFLVMLIPVGAEWEKNPASRREELERFCREEGIALLDLFPILEAIGGMGYHGHPPPRVHDRIARALRAELHRRGWF